MNSRAEVLFGAHRSRIYRRTDRMFAILFIIQYLCSILAALYVSPLAWEGTKSSVHVHVWAAIFLGFFICSLPVAFAYIMPGRVLTRHVVAIGQMLFSALLIHLTGGRIETHFHIFGSLAFLSFYKDWRVLISALVVVALDHYFRGAYWPQSVYGVISPSSWRWLEHTSWVIFEDLFLTLACFQSVQEMREIAQRRAELEESNEGIERAVIQRTQELQKSNENLQAAQYQLLQSQKLESIGQLAGGIAHDFNNILTSVIGYVGLLQMELRDNAKATEMLTIVDRSAKRGGELVSQLLSFARKGDYEKKRLSLNAIINEANTLICRSLGKHISVKLSMRGDLPEIEGDSSQILQVLMNLAVNARDAMPICGELEFKTSTTVLNEDFCLYRPGLTPGTYVLLEVNDTGCGMPPEVQAKIFDPFFTTKDPGKGTGLGLAMAYGIVQNHRGTIAVESEVGIGTSFKIFLPICSTEAVTVSDSPSPVHHHSNTLQKLKGKTILLVDDEPTIHSLVREIFRGSETTILSAFDGIEAVHLYESQKHPADLVLLDVIMPRMNGVQVFEKIRALGCEAPVLIGSGFSESKDIQKILQQENVAYIQKPFTAAQLLTKLSAL